MNRKTEYYNLLTELEDTPIELDYTLTRAKSKLKYQHKRNFFIVPISSLVSLLIVFTLLVNCSTAFAKACQNIPLIKELSQLVEFSPSLTAALKNDYIQPIELEQTKNNITTRVEYVIVDQKQLNIFYSLDSNKYSSMEATPEIRSLEGNALESYSISSGSFDESNGDLRQMVVDFVGKDMPNGLELTFKVHDNNNLNYKNSIDDFSSSNNDYTLPNYISTFKFQLKFNPYYTSQGETITLNQTFEIDNQTLTITNAEIYPTHIRLNFDDVDNNTAWLNSLEFYLENEDGKRYETIKNGISASGSTDSPMMKSHRLESTFFSKSEKLTLHITGVTWLDKDMQKIKVNLKDKTIDTLPKNVTLENVKKRENNYTLTFSGKQLKDNATYQLFSWNYYDENDKEYSFKSISSMNGNNEDSFNEILTLKDYPYDVVYLSPVFSRKVKLSCPIEIQIK